uniref:Uncharacterized protein n=1 Tax=Trypanosoma vivax (strain Y486) TaxID=1055687 RepID=G0TY44_TRYVY|nr:hypothetical protein, unlikely [Trypanosoma vivax Y486]
MCNFIRLHTPHEHKYTHSNQTTIGSLGGGVGTLKNQRRESFKAIFPCLVTLRGAGAKQIAGREKGAKIRQKEVVVVVRKSCFLFPFLWMITCTTGRVKEKGMPMLNIGYNNSSAEMGRK